MDPLEPIEYDADPERCQSVTVNGQCRNKCVPGQKGCAMHCSPAKERKAANRQFQLTRWRTRVSEFADAPEIKSLREEIGIIRMILENTINMCDDHVSLLINSDKISKMVNDIDKLVNSCHKLEEKTGQVLDKTQIGTILDVIIKAITDQVADPDIIEAIQLKIEVELCQVLQISLSTRSEQVLQEPVLAMQGVGLKNIV